MWGMFIVVHNNNHYMTYYIYPSAVTWLNSIPLLCQTASCLIQNAVANEVSMQIWKHETGFL